MPGIITPGLVMAVKSLVVKITGRQIKRLSMLRQCACVNKLVHIQSLRVLVAIELGRVTLSNIFRAAYKIGCSHPPSAENAKEVLIPPTPRYKHTSHETFLFLTAWYSIASFTGLQEEREGLLPTVCACAKCLDIFPFIYPYTWTFFEKIYWKYADKEYKFITARLYQSMW